MEINVRAAFVGFLYQFLRIQITGALFFGLDVSKDSVLNNKHNLEIPRFLYNVNYQPLNHRTLQHSGNWDLRKKIHEGTSHKAKNVGEYKFDSRTKRFFHFSPFIIHFEDRGKPWTPKVKPKPNHEKFVDHFSGILPKSLHTSNKKIKTEDSIRSEKQRNENLGSSNLENDDSKDKHISTLTEEMLPFQSNTLSGGPSVATSFSSGRDTTIPSGFIDNSESGNEDTYPETDDSINWLKRKLEEDTNSNSKLPKPFLTKPVENLDTPGWSFGPSKEPQSDGFQWLSNRIGTKPDSRADKYDLQDDGFLFPGTSSSEPIEQRNNGIDLSGFNTGYDSLSPYEAFTDRDDGTIPMDSGFVINDQPPISSLFETLEDFNAAPVVGPQDDRTRVEAHVGRGSFNHDNAHCYNIDTKTCSSSLDCSCYGMYTCSDMRCVSFESLLSSESSPESPVDTGQWFDTPFDVDAWTK
ncbi:hypothetical protein ACF0H5_014010 [Mactra antiquata]